MAHSRTHSGARDSHNAANTTIYTVVRGMALRPLPFDEPGRLTFIGELSPAGRREAMAPANFADLVSQSHAFGQMALHRGARLILTGRPVPEAVIGANVSSTFFSVLRAQPQHGRVFLAQDDQPGGTRAAMLSNNGWVQLFSQDAAIVGRSITLDGIDHLTTIRQRRRLSASRRPLRIAPPATPTTR